MEFTFIALLYAELADVLRTAVIAFVVTLFNLLFFFLVDAPDVAHHMAGQMAEWVIAKQPGFDFNAWKSKLLGREFGHFFVGQSRANRQRVEVFRLFSHALETPFVAQRNVNDFRQAVDGGLQIFHARRRNFQGVSRVVVGQHHAIAIENGAAVGHSGKHSRSVVFGLF